MVSGITFDQQLITAANMGHFMYTFSGKKSGITKGCTITRSGLSISIATGYFLSHGRMSQVTSTETITLDALTEGQLYCRLIYRVDLSKTNTSSSFLQGEFKVLTSSTAYPTLTQQDLDDYPSDGIFDLPFAKFTQTASGIDNWVDERIFFNNDLTTVSVPASGWTGSGPYTQTITVSEMIERENPAYSLLIPDTATDSEGEAMLEAFGYIGKLTTGTGTITIKAYGTQPDVDMTIQLIRS